MMFCDVDRYWLPGKVDLFVGQEHGSQMNNNEQFNDIFLKKEIYIFIISNCALPQIIVVGYSDHLAILKYPVDT